MVGYRSETTRLYSLAVEPVCQSDRFARHIDKLAASIGCISRIFRNNKTARSHGHRPPMLPGDLFYPVDGLAVEPFLDDKFGRGRRGVVPVLIIPREPNYVT
jgi:hypothetical protein